jgi:hypothetical protein
VQNPSMIKTGYEGLAGCGGRSTNRTMANLPNTGW